MRRLYSLCLYFLLPLALLRLVVKGVKSPAYLRRWGERFGYFPRTLENEGIWIHAVSVGEAIAAFPLVERLRRRYPALPIAMTTTTPTGSERVTRQFGDSIAHGYLPYDLSRAVRRFLDRARPRIAIIMETEIWPNLYAACEGRNIPVVLANARLSDRSARGYRRLAALTRATVGRVSHICAQSRADAARFIDLGAPAERVQVIGNLKFDVSMPPELHRDARQLRKEWGPGRPVLIAASTHDGEEEQVLSALDQLRGRADSPLLVLVPRHPERFDRVAALCTARGYNVVRRTQHRPCAATTDVFIGDTMGELRLFYAAADVAFVGGSLVASGGHNPLEPAALRLPVLFGPHMFNFEEIERLLLEAGGAQRVTNATELALAVDRYLSDDRLRAETGARGFETVEENRGALDRLLEVIDGELRSRGLSKPI